MEATATFEAYRGGPTATSGDDFETLVQAEMRKGVSRAIAGQRVVLKYGARPDASQVRKSQSAAVDFMAEVNTVMIEKGCVRTAAMEEVRTRNPGLYDAFQEV